MATNTLGSIDFAQLQQKLSAQFSGLDPKDPAAWPALPQYVLFLVVSVAIVTALWFVWLTGEDDVLKQEEATEVTLRADYKVKLAKAVNLEVLKKQREQVLQYVTQLEKQLPSKAEMDALLSDINSAGLGRSLQFDVFRPGNIVVRDYYAELPITLRVTGKYHDIGAFASDIANLSRIVTLNNLTIAPRADGALVLDSTAKTFRYLDKDEVAAQSKAVKGTKK
jgi:type IV pilus assembly protein PilO